MKLKREYLRLLEKAIHALEGAVDSFNSVHQPYRNETTLILMTNAWELLSKAVLVRAHKSIAGDRPGTTISAEVAVSRLRHERILDENQEDCIQQVVSLRNAAVHHLLPDVPAEVMHHLLFFCCKFFRELTIKVFRSHAKELKDDFLSLSFSNLTTYADKIQKLVSRVRKSEHDKTLVWLLERGVRFDGATYMNQDQFEAQYRRKKRIMPHLQISDFIKNTDMVRIIPVQAPRNYTADLTLRKGSKRDASLPVVIKKTDIESDYPYLTKELALKLNRNSNFMAATIAALGLKGDPTYHQPVRASQTSHIQRYSQAAYDRIAAHLRDNPEFDPYQERRRAK
ncbi:MAG: hypothetical protein H7A43_10625 [Verrucomicrobia bacterium]|nr:hypothetical protein [Verrucomicrobiota bacterium]